MDDLIFREWVLKRMQFAPDADVVKMAPAVNDVPVFRCKDCRWYDSVAFGCVKDGIFREPDFFCANVAKKDGDTE